MKNKELARLFFREVLKIQHHESLETAGKIQALYRLLNQLFVQVTLEEKLQFTTMFARISFACQKRQVAPQTQFYIHAFRKAAVAINLDPDPQNLEKELLLGLKVTTDSIVSFLTKYHHRNWQSSCPLVLIIKFRRLRFLILSLQPGWLPWGLMLNRSNSL